MEVAVNLNQAYHRGAASGSGTPKPGWVAVAHMSRQNTAFLISSKTVNSVSSGGQCGRNSEGNLNNIYIFELD